MKTPKLSDCEKEAIKWENYRENTRYLWEDTLPHIENKTKAELDEKYKDFQANVQSGQ